MYDLTDCSETPILEMLDEETPIVEMLDDMDDPRDTNTEMTLIVIADDSQDAPNIEHMAKESCPEVSPMQDPRCERQRHHEACRQPAGNVHR